MPDLTLYNDDVMELYYISSAFRTRVRRDFNNDRPIAEDEQRLYESAERLMNLLMDRVVQKLHPTKEQNTT